MIVAVVAVPFVTAAAVVLTSRIDNRRPSDVIVVLGTTQFDGRPQAVLQARLDHAKVLYDGGVAPRIITVGGKEQGDRFTEAQAGRNYLVAAGVPSKNIVAVGVGRDTYTSMQAVARTMDAKGWCTAVLVSDPWHMMRTRAMARNFGIDAVTSPTRSGPTQRGPAALRYVVRETAARLYYGVTQEFSTKTIVTGCA
jgi:uncharacterized SAM-binding protein YcdF (DUF218 family)